MAESLDDIAAAAVAIEAPTSSPAPVPADPAAQAAALAAESRETAREQLRPISAALVQTLGAVVCTRAQVAQLTRAEVSMLSESIAGVGAFYLPKVPTEKTAAWLSLGMAATAVVAVRLDLPALGGPPAPSSPTRSPGAAAPTSSPAPWFAPLPAEGAAAPTSSPA